MSWIPNLLAASLPLGLFGGIIFALHPRPSRIWLARSIGGACGILSFLCGLAFVIADRLVNGSTALWLLLTIALLPGMALWFLAAFFTDQINGGRIFGHTAVAFEVVKDD